MNSVVWHVEQVCWDATRTKGQAATLLVEARTCAEAAALAGESDGVEIKRITSLGPIVGRSPDCLKKRGRNA